MMRKMLMILMAGVILGSFPSIGRAQHIRGTYVETRSADVYTGPCFANAEVGLVGDRAILAWRIERGQWQGVRLDGLSVVGVIKAKATLGDPYSDPYPADAVLIVDQRATPEQRAALIRFAEEMGGRLLARIVRIEVAPIQLDVTFRGEHPVKAELRAGQLAAIRTRPLTEKDHICGNEIIYYPPLVRVSHSMPAVAELDQYRGPGLNVSWTSRGKRSAFVGTFWR